MVVQGVHTSAHSREALSHGYPEGRIAHPEGFKGSLRGMQKK